MFIVPKGLSTDISTLVDFADSPTDTVKESATKMVSVEYKESFTELTHPTEIDKMLLPASPQVDSSAVHGNFEKQKQINKGVLDPSTVEGDFEKQKQITSEGMQQLINSLKLRNLKI